MLVSCVHRMIASLLATLCCLVSTAHADDCAGHWEQKPGSPVRGRSNGAMAYFAGSFTNGDKLLVCGGYPGPNGGNIADWYLVRQFETWTDSFACGALPRRSYNAMAYDIDQAVCVEFGGQWGGAGLHEAVLEWNGLCWINRGAPPGPGKIMRHGMCEDHVNRGVLLHGGMNFSNTVLNKTWLWESGLGTWRLLSQTGPQLCDFAIAYDTRRQRAVLFGGRQANQPLADTWEWDGVQWTKLSIPGPSARVRPAMAYDPKLRRVVLFGGQNGSTFYGDTWEFDGASWKLMSTTGPSPRAGAMAAFDSQTVVLFGGLDATLDPINETWEWVREETPDLTSDLQDQEVCEGAKLHLEFSYASNNWPTCIRWYRNGAAINECNGGSKAISLFPWQYADGDRFRAEFIGACGILPTREMTVRVRKLPYLAGTQGGGNYCVGSTAELRAIYYNGLPDQIRWSKNGIVIPGATTDRITLANITPASAGTYTCEGLNDICPDTLLATINVGVSTSPPSASGPDDAHACLGGSAAFSVWGNAGFYQWERDGVPLADGPTSWGSIISGATARTLHLSNVGSADAGLYRTKMSNGCGTAMSNAASLILCKADSDCSGFVDGDDFDHFVNTFIEGGSEADFDGSGFVDTDDFTGFVLAFEEGC